MRSVSELYNIQERPTYEEVIMIERRAMQMRNEVISGMFSSFFGMISSAVKKVLSFNVHNHRRASLS